MCDAIGWDAHAHVIGDPRVYPFAPGRGYTPSPASLADYLAMLDRHGIARGVLVQPSVYGHDHRCLLDALAGAGGRLRGVAVPSPDATPRDLEALHRHGVRGVRCNLINPGGLSPTAVAVWQPALRAMGWHVELHLPIDRGPAWTDVIESFDVPVVVDHMGRPAPGALDPSSPPLAALIRLVAQERCFVKLSAPYRLSAETPQATAGNGVERGVAGAGIGAPDQWSDVTPLAQAFLEANASACCWGSDWPHVDTAPPIDTPDLITALDEWRGDQWTRRQITGDLAERLFG